MITHVRFPSKVNAISRSSDEHGWERAMIEHVESDGVPLALILRHNQRTKGIEFFTPPEATLQLGYMSRPAGYLIQPHVHMPVQREVSYTQEVLFVRSGRVRVDFYDEAKHFVQSATLVAGDVILLVRGGHGFEILEESELIEVKQGPYVGDHDKARFDPGQL